MSPSDGLVGSQLFAGGGSAFAVTTLDESPLATWFNRATVARPDIAIRRVRGRLSRTTRGFWNEASAALQFPYYFTAGWPGFSEVIRDLAWLPGAGYVLVICDAPHLFVDEGAQRDEEWATLVPTLERARDYWEQRHVDADSRLVPIPFRVLLQASADAAREMTARVQRAGSSAVAWVPDDDA